MKKISWDRRLLIGLIAFSLAQVGLQFLKPSNQEAETNHRASVDTFVPLGFTLVPIQIENIIELDSLIDRFAIVDLHKKGTPGSVAEGVRLLRSPNNPEVFAVLIEQERAKELISKYGAQFTVSLRNPKSAPPEKVVKRTIIKD